MTKNRTYVAFDGDNDIRYYRLMLAWKRRDSSSFNFHDAHEINTSRDSSQEESIKRQLRERMNYSNIFVLLVGESTRYLRKFVKWEIETAIKLEIPIICVNINGSRQKDNLCPASLDGQLAIFIPFELKIMQYAFDHWPHSHAQKIKEGKSGAYRYNDSVYQQL